ncbi:hypothetical protein NP233_g10338 [Leucocoprinus birnbaumii]|uniref:Uncharacterized protein n=1 Tax=Leucocoprinus birnbaumii TaxID=56174 RepID=A0AAD5VII0_9AGAR|nr:hypothetical protein NP233_g10338 [Leucocoprinus birnbaumii]
MDVPKLNFRSMPSFVMSFERKKALSNFDDIIHYPLPPRQLVLPSRNFRSSTVVPGSRPVPTRGGPRNWLKQDISNRALIEGSIPYSYMDALASLVDNQTRSRYTKPCAYSRGRLSSQPIYGDIVAQELQVGKGGSICLPLFQVHLIHPAMSKTVETGHYTIFCAAPSIAPPPSPIGVSLTPEAEEPVVINGHSKVWKVTKLDNGNYTIVLVAPSGKELTTKPLEDNLYIDADMAQPFEWKVTYATKPFRGFVIQVPGGDKHADAWTILNEVHGSPVFLSPSLLRPS